MTTSVNALSKPNRVIWRRWIAGGVLAVALQNIVHLVACVIDPLQLDYSEGLVLGGIERIVQHPALAAAYSFNPNFYNTTDLAYPPVFPYGAAGLSELFKLIPGLSFPALYAARTLTLLGIGLSVWLVYRLVRLRQADRWLAGASAALFFCFHPTIYWGVYARVDALGLAFALGGLYLVARAEFVRRPVFGGSLSLWEIVSPMGNVTSSYNRAYWLAVPLCGLAFFTKQSLVAVPAAIVLYLFFTGRKRQALGFAGTLALLIGLSIAGLALLTDGKYFFFLTLERFTSFSVPKLLKTGGLFLLLYGPICALALWRARRAWQTGGERLLVVWGGLTALIALTVGKAGAADYYFFELMAFICIMIGWGAGTPLKIRRVGLVAGLAGLQLVILLVLGFWLDYPANDRDAVRAADGQAANYIRQYAAPDQKVFVEMSGPAIAAGRPEQIFDHFIFRQLAQAGQRDGQALVRDFANKRFKLALFGYDILHDNYRPDVTEFTPWPPGFELAIRANYHLLQDIRGTDGRPYAWALLPN